MRKDGALVTDLEPKRENTLGQWNAKGISCRKVFLDGMVEGSAKCTYIYSRILAVAESVSRPILLSYKNQEADGNILHLCILCFKSEDNCNNGTDVKCINPYNCAISGASHDNLVRFSAISSFHQCLFQ